LYAAFTPALANLPLHAGVTGKPNVDCLRALLIPLQIAKTPRRGSSLVLLPRLAYSLDPRSGLFVDPFSQSGVSIRTTRQSYPSRLLGSSHIQQLTVIFPLLDPFFPFKITNYKTSTSYINSLLSIGGSQRCRAVSWCERRSRTCGQCGEASC